MNQPETPQPDQNPQEQPPADPAPTCARKCSWWRWPLIVIIIALVIMAIRKRTNGPAGPGIEWQTDYPVALAAAAHQNKPVLLAFHIPGCPACISMKKNVYHDPAVIETAQKFIPVLVMADQNPEIADQYPHDGYPTYFILKSDATPVDTIVGAFPAEEFNQNLTTAYHKTHDH